MRVSFSIAEEIFRENKGILQSSQAQSLGINPLTLSDMVQAGLLVRESRGLYRLSDLEPPGNPDLIFVHHRVPEAVICLISALALYGLTTQIPYKVYIALRADSRNRPRIAYPPIQVVWISKGPYHAGVEHQMVDGFSVPIYGREKTIADCFKFRGKIGTDVAIEALKAYAGLRDRDIPKLIEYARIDRVDKVMCPYLEALV